MLERFDHDWELIHEVIDLFLTECPTLMADITDAIAHNDAAALYQSAHSFKGAVSNLGAEAVVATVAHLERMGRAEDLTHAPAAQEELAAMLPPLTAALTTLRQTPPS